MRKFSWASLALAWSLGACRGGSTALRVHVLSDLPLTGVQVRGWRGAATAESSVPTDTTPLLTLADAGAAGQVREVGSLALRPRAEGSWEVPVTLRVQGFVQGSSAPAVTQLVTVSYTPGATRELYVRLLGSCANSACCGGTTCECGACVPVDSFATVPLNGAAPACVAPADAASCSNPADAAREGSTPAGDAGLDASDASDAGPDASDASEAGDALFFPDGACVPGATLSCYTGPAATRGVGQCREGMQFCLVNSAVTACLGEQGPSAEVCDGMDNNCNGSVDEGLTVSCFADTDGDGYAPLGAPAQPRCPVRGRDAQGGCPGGFTNRRPDPASRATVDCDDADASRSPGLPELCDVTAEAGVPVDENCDGVANPPDLCMCMDGDQRACPQPGRCASGMQRCAGSAWLACSVAPAAESCNGLDDDCNGMVDEGLGSTTCGLGACRRAVSNCAGGAAQSCTPDLSQRSAERCNGLDDDCDGVVDNGVRVQCYTDLDGDSYAPLSATASMQCLTMGRERVGGCPSGFTNRAPTDAPSSDCNDADGATNPQAPEVCDALMADENCDGRANEGCNCTNGMSRPCAQPGRCASGTQTCVGGAWASCSVAPTAESCNGVDDDCNGMVDDGLGTTTCGNAACQRTVQNCASGAAQSCAPDASAATAERCNNLDDDCDGAVDNGAAASCAALLHAVNTCVAGVCDYSACQAGFADCDGDRSNGCEADLTSPQSCGSCANRCGAAASCLAGRCDRVTAVSAGSQFGCALREGGRVACWGSNSQGQLGGASTAATSAAPVAIATSEGVPLSNVRALASGAAHNCALLADSTVSCWGSNSSGQLGNGVEGAGVFSRDPVVVRTAPGVTLTDVVEVAAVASVTCARTRSNALLCWGNNGSNQAGQASTANLDYATPVLPPSMTGLTAFAWRGPLSMESSATCALANITPTAGAPTTAAYCFGSASLGQLGGPMVLSPGVPQPVVDASGATVTGVVGLAAAGGGLRSNALLMPDGTARTFGSNATAQLGLNSTAFSVSNASGSLLAAASTPFHLTAYAANQAGACVLDAGSALYCWGLEALLPTGLTITGVCPQGVGSPAPTNCALLPQPVSLAGSPLVLQSITAGFSFFCGLRGTDVLCWGNNSASMIGQPASTTLVLTPTPIAGF